MKFSTPLGTFLTTSPLLLQFLKMVEPFVDPILKQKLQKMGAMLPITPHSYVYDLVNGHRASYTDEQVRAHLTHHLIGRAPLLDEKELHTNRGPAQGWYKLMDAADIITTIHSPSVNNIGFVCNQYLNRSEIKSMLGVSVGEGENQYQTASQMNSIMGNLSKAGQTMEKRVFRLVVDPSAALCKDKSVLWKVKTSRGLRAFYVLPVTLDGYVPEFTQVVLQHASDTKTLRSGRGGRDSMDGTQAESFTVAEISMDVAANNGDMVGYYSMRCYVDDEMVE